MKIRKNAIILSAIAMLLISSFAIMSGKSQGTKLTVDIIDNPGLGPGSTFQAIIWVHDVADMWGYNFFLHYDTSVLTAIDYGSYYPFTEEFKIEINDDKGSVGIGYSYPLEPPVPKGGGWYWTGAYPIAFIVFSVDDLGGSMFDLTDSVISDPLGDPIEHTCEDGWFRNKPGIPIAWFPPMDPIVGEPVTFPSLSIDPEGWIELFDWDWGDGTTHGTLEVEIHAWESEGTYTMTLEVTDNEGNKDSQAATVEVTAPPPAGAIAIEGWTSYTGINPGTSPKIKVLDFTKYGDKVIRVKAMVKNLDEANPVLVRVVFWFYSIDAEEMMGSIEMPWMWLDPGAKELFQTSFSALDYWPYGLPGTDFDITVDVYFMDYEISPGQPHWALVEDPPEIPILFAARETPPVPVFALHKEAEPFTYTLDATGSYDADEKWGDYIDHGITRWVIVDPEEGVIGLFYSGTKTFTFPHAGTYYIQMRIHDSFGVRVYYNEGNYFPIEVTE